MFSGWLRKIFSVTKHGCKWEKKVIFKWCKLEKGKEKLGILLENDFHVMKFSVLEDFFYFIQLFDMGFSLFSPLMYVCIYI